MNRAESARSDSTAGFHTAEFGGEQQQQPEKVATSNQENENDEDFDKKMAAAVSFSDTDVLMDTSEHSHGSHRVMHDTSQRLHSFYKNHLVSRKLRPKLGNGFAARIFKKYPRSYACTCGIIIPVWILVLSSLLFGKFLGELEAGGEIENNDATMRARKVRDSYNEAVSDTLNSLPTFCYMLYKNRTEPTNLTNKFREVLTEAQTLEVWIDTQPNLTGNTIVNVSKFATFMDECGKAADTYRTIMWDDWFGSITDDLDGDDDPTLSFNWNRCLNYTKLKSSNLIFNPSEQQLSMARPARQRQTYRKKWNADFDAKFQQYQAEGKGNSSTSGVVDYRLDAFNRSLYEASGRDTCTVNVAGSAWFWFTIMTTVGYGNQAPSSAGGRALSFTAGFLCILLFGAVLAASGTILSLIVFDIVYRLKIELLLKKQVMMLIWGLLWCIWMIGMSYMYMQWSLSRLGDEVRWQDAYWFSYISTTTVGLGDFYQAPEVLFISDLLAFSLSYLFGFVLLSTFLAELGQLLAQNLPDMSIELGKRLVHVAPGITSDDDDTPPAEESQFSSGNDLKSTTENVAVATTAPVDAEIDTGSSKNLKDDGAYDGMESRA